jgi:glycine/D-amino acid oxidase-like deaminating enzyme
MIDSAADLNLAGHALTPGAQRSWWLREALAREEGDPAPPLAANVDVDVAIIGGGFTGLWTAYFLTRADPNLGVVVLEQDICGGGPSGRNGGFASGWWDELDGLVTLYGEEGAVKACRAISDSINTIGQFCEQHSIDAWFRRAGYMYVETAAAHRHVRDDMVGLARKVGAPDELQTLGPEEVRARCSSPVFRSGAFMNDGASVQPAFLARGLRRVAIESGVTIHENTPVTRLEPGLPVRLATPNGSVRAKHVVLALNAWATAWPQLERRLVAWSSYIVLTAPAPDRLKQIGWTGGELISDFRTSMRYFRTTPDGRIAFGGGGGRARRKIDDVFTRDSRAVMEAAQGFRLMFPTFADVPLEDAWGGPIDVSPTHLPAFGSLDPGNLFFAVGYTGNGVAPSHLAGQILADLVTKRDTDNVRLPMVNPKPRLFPPQPFRSWGAAAVRRAMIAEETAEERGRRPNFLVSQMARMPRRMGYLLGH